MRTIWLRGPAEGEWLSGIHDSAGALATAVRKDDAGTWTLAGASTFSGSTVISNGTLRVQGRLGPGPVHVYGGSLGGSGAIGGPTAIYGGATLAPELPGLAISNSLVLLPQSVTRMEINAAAGTVSTVRGLSSLSLAGSLVVSNVAGQVVAGKTFDLFDAASTSGNFTSLPPAGGGIYWRFEPATGWLTALALPKPNISGVALASGQFVFSITNGIPGSTVVLLSATNAALPAASWIPVATNIFGPSGSLAWTNLIDPGSPQRFFQAALP
jgi:autotransporter-associated beta strand protein